MLSQTAEYALRAMLVLTVRPKQARTVQDIASHSKVPVNYLAKILRALGRAELLLAQRGPGGGFRPARTADAITVLDVVNAVDPLKRIKVCPLGLAAHQRRLCPLHSKIDDAVRSAEEAFAATTLASLAEEPVAFVEEQEITDVAS